MSCHVVSCLTQLEWHAWGHVSGVVRPGTREWGHGHGSKCRDDPGRLHSFLQPSPSLLLSSINSRLSRGLGRTNVSLIHPSTWRKVDYPSSSFSLTSHETRDDASPTPSTATSSLLDLIVPWRTPQPPGVEKEKERKHIVDPRARVPIDRACSSSFWSRLR